MRLTKRAMIFAVLGLAGACPALADTASFTGTLANSTDVFSLVFNVAGTSSQAVTVQTWGFGGGTNADGKPIAAGGFDPFVGIFSDTGPAASIVTDGLGNPFGSSDLLSNFTSFSGCGPAGIANIGGPVCGDLTMNLVLGPGAYTLVLSDAGYIANAVFDNGTLGEGFADFTVGVLETCNTTDAGTSCVNDTANWAFDLTTSPNSGGGTPATTPEPSSLLLASSALLAAACWRRRKTFVVN